MDMSFHIGVVVVLLPNSRESGGLLEPCDASSLLSSVQSLSDGRLNLGEPFFSDSRLFPVGFG